MAAVTGIERFAGEYGAKYPKAVESLGRDQDALLTFFDFPAEHWANIRTSNPIELERHREPSPTRVRALLEMAQQRWRGFNAGELLPLVRAGGPLPNGTQLQREDQAAHEQPAEIAA